MKAEISEEPDDEVILNFDNADIYEVIKTFAEIFDLNYIVDPAVKGTVNISTRGKISNEDLFDIFLMLLKVNGASAVQEGTIYHIVPTSGARSKLLKTVEGDDVGRPNDRVVIQAMRLDFIPVTEVVGILQPFLTHGADIKAFAKNNTLILTDFASNIVKLVEIVDLLDVNLFKDVGVRLFPVEHTGAEDVSKDLEALFGALELTTGSTRSAGVKFISIKRINSILVVSSIPGVFDEVEKWLVELDSVSGLDQERIFIYHVKNGIADELAEILQSVFSDDNSRKKAVSSKEADGKTQNKANSKTAVVPKIGESLVGTVSGKVKVTPYPSTNTIIIKASKRDYKVVKSILGELDIIPRQVLIETVIAEVTLSEALDLGIEYASLGAETGGVREHIVGTSLGLSPAGTLASGGFTASIVRGDFLATFNALASENKVNILASPHIIATDGKEASIDIGEEVPLVASKIFIDQREEVTIERRDTGVIFKVTPHINTTGLVILDINLELSDAASVAVEGESDIRIFQRNAVTTMVVQDSQTVIIGGLIDKKNEKEIVKVPLLGDIPILGLLFRAKKDLVKKTELVLLLTPHVINNVKDADNVTKEFVTKLNTLKEELKDEIGLERFNDE